MFKLEAEQGSVDRQQVLQADEVDIGELGRVVWGDKWLIVSIIVVFSVGATLYALSMPNEYRATAILSPASTSGSSSVSRLAGQFGGLASLAGLNLAGASSGGKAMVAMELLNTWGFLESFITLNSLEVEVFAVQGWDKLTNELIIDQAIYDVESSAWVREIDSIKGGGVEPTSWELFSKINNRIEISQDKETGLISLSVEHYSPFVAKKWVDLLIIAINKHIQTQDREEALSSIDYLKVQVSKTSIAEMQAVFYQLIEEQAKILMLAEISDEYVLKTLSPAKVAEEKVKPKRKVIVVLGAMLGLLFASLIVLARFFMVK